MPPNGVRSLIALRRRWSVGLAGLVAGLAALGLLPYGLIAREPLPRADAIVVLSGSATYQERTQWAAQLWREGRAPRIILTNDGQSAGWDEWRQRNPSFAEREADELRRGGVPNERIVILPQIVTNTHEESARVRDYAEANGLHSLIFVTSPYHTRRARWTLARVFAGSELTVGVDAPAAGQQSPRPFWWWTSIVGWKLVPGEYLKFVYYQVKY